MSGELFDVSRNAQAVIVKPQQEIGGSIGFNGLGIRQPPCQIVWSSITMNIADKLHLTGNVVLPTACLLAVSIGAALVIDAQTKTGNVQTSHPPAVAHWQVTAGGKMAFEVAAVKQSPPDTFAPPNFPLDSGNAFTDLESGDPPRGRFSAIFPLSVFIEFAYKLTPEQRKSMLSHLPKWVDADAFEIHARSQGNPTKDQMRLMMQSLLADRFKLAVHFETQQGPVLALTLAKPGKLGPGLRPHAEGPPCDVPASGRDLVVFPRVCDVFNNQGSSSKPLWGARNTTMELLAGFLSASTYLNRPVVNETGLSGNFDFRLEWTVDPDASRDGPTRTMSKTGSNSGRGGVSEKNQASAPSDVLGPTLLEALREQLGLKLVSTRGSIEVLVVDHVERPSEN